MKKERGFTIVELLIVIVVIAILAAITIVAYNGIQNRAKASAAQSLANNIAKKAQAFNTLGSAYPADVAAFEAAAGNESELDAASKTALVIAVPTDEKTVQYRYCDTGKGAQIVYYDATASATKTIQLGSSTSCANVTQ